MSLFRKKVNLGIDIGSHSLKLAITDSRRKEVEVWISPIYPDRSYRDDILSGEALKNRLKVLILKAEQELKGWNKSVVVGVQGQNLVCGYLEVPVLADEELEMAVLSNISREVPFPIDSLEVTHIPVTPLISGRKAVFYSAWKKVLGQRAQSLCESCGLKVKHIEATGISLTRELFQNRALDSSKFYAIVNIGFELTQFIVVRAGYPYYLRDIPIGGRDITYAVQVGSQVSWGEAEEIKCNHPLYELTHTAGPILSELSYELGRSITYFQKHFIDERIETIFLSGGGAQLKDLPDWLEEEIRVPVRLEGWQQLQPSKADSLAHLHKISLGLALV